MGKKQPHKVFRKRFFDGHYEGQVQLEAETLRIAFSYSPERLAALKRLAHARFDKEDKTWSLPITLLDKLQELPLFSAERILYAFPRQALLLSPEDRQAQITLAQSSIKKDPYTVPEALIGLAYPDFAVRFSGRGPSLRIVPRFDSKATALIEKIPQSHFIQGDQAYFVPTQFLGDLLRRAREHDFTFAVEKECGERLKATASKRAAMLKTPQAGGAEDLQLCALVPFVTSHETSTDPCFVLHYATTPQLRELYPKTNAYAERKALSTEMGESDLLELMHQAQRQGITLFLTNGVQHFLESRKEHLGERITKNIHSFSEALLTVTQPDLCWMVDEHGQAGLLAKADLIVSQFDSHPKNPLYKTPRSFHQHHKEHLFFAPHPLLLPKTYEAVGSFILSLKLSAPPQSPAFSESLSGARRRVQLLNRRDHFLQLNDAVLDTSNLSSPEIGTKLFPHQRVAVQWLCETPSAFLGDDMGLGKTLSVLTYFEALRAKGECDFLLVICPNSLTRNWARETKQWFPAHNLGVLSGEKSDKKYYLYRLTQGNLALNGLALNYEALRLDYVTPEIAKILRERKVLLCLDESQRTKNPASKTFEVLSQLSTLARRKVLLSGTPIPKDITDIWAQMYILDGGERFGKNYYTWLAQIAELGNDYSDYAIKRFRTREVKEVIGRVHELLLRRKKEDVVSLPPKLFSVRDIELSGEQLSRYDEIRRELLLRVTTKTGKTFIREISSILEQYLRAVQAASNPRLIDPTWKGDPVKFLELDSIVEEIVAEREEKIVIWTNYLGNVRELSQRYARYGAAPFSGEVDADERQETIRRFQNEAAPKVLVAIPAAGGVGITLTAAQTVVYVDKTWNAEHWLQSIDRVHRIGQKGTVSVISLSACKVDDLIAANLSRKSRAQAALLGDSNQGLFKHTPAPERQEDEYPSREELLAALGS